MGNFKRLKVFLPVSVTAKFRGNVPETLENEQASAYTLEVPKSKHSSGGETKMVEKKCTGNEHVDGGCQSGISLYIIPTNVLNAKSLLNLVMDMTP